MSVYVYSTLSQDVCYIKFKDKGELNGNSIPTPEHKILIKGGANVFNKNLVTPKGYVTEVTEKQLEILEQNHVFQAHVKDGFITIDKKKKDPEKAARDMKERDNSAQPTEKEFNAVAGEDGPRVSSIGHTRLKRK